MNLQDKIRQKIQNLHWLAARQQHNMPIPQDMLAEDGAWLAVTSTDWSLLTPEQLRLHGKKIKGILALDDATTVMAIECGLPYMLWEDFMDFDNFEGTHQSIIDNLRLWYKDLENYYTDESCIVWPEVDNQALFWFWNDIAFTCCIEEKLDQNNISLIVVRHEPFIPALYYLSKDNFGRMCASFQSSKISNITINFEANNSTTLNIHNHITEVNVGGKLLCALLSDEIYRCRVMIHKLHEIYKDNFVLATLTPYKNRVFEGIPVASAFTKNNQSTSPLFENSWEHLRKKSTIFPKNLRVHILNNLYWYHMHRWPALKRQTNFLIDYFTHDRPACVIGSNLMYSESQLAIIAANTLNIPTLCWGHAYTSNFRGWHSFCAKKVLITTKLDLHNAAQLNIKKETIVPIDDIELKNILPASQKTEKYFKTNKLRILILPPASRLNGQASIYANLRSEAQYLHALTNPPHDLEQLVEPRIKGHPWLSDRAPYFMADIDEARYAIPNSTGLDDVLAECDCCVAINYDTCGFYFSAMQHPTAILIDDNIFISINEHGRISEKKYNNFYTNINEIWDFIRYLLKHPEKHQEIVESQKKFLSLDKSITKNWLDVIQEQALPGMR